MSERVWKRPNGESEGEFSVKFIRPKSLADEGFVGDLLEGTFLEAIENKYDPNKYDYKFEQEDGTIVIVNHAGNLAHRMKEVSPGDFCKIVYEGKKEMKKGTYKGTMAHSFDVLVA
jgi:hypothetical protein